MKTTKQYGKKTDLALAMWVKLTRAHDTFNHLTAANIRTFGLTPAQFGVIECLGHLGSMLIGDLTKKHLVSGGNMTVVVDNLEKDGLVERLVSDEDHRAFYVKLTPKGKRLFDKIFLKRKGEMLRKQTYPLLWFNYRHTAYASTMKSCQSQLLPL